jgi:hypothetical protein
MASSRRRFYTAATFVCLFCPRVSAVNTPRKAHIHTDERTLGAVLGIVRDVRDVTDEPAENTLNLADTTLNPDLEREAAENYACSVIVDPTLCVAQNCVWWVFCIVYPVLLPMHIILVRYGFVPTTVSDIQHVIQVSLSAA